VFIPKLMAYFTPFAPSVPTLTFAPEAMELAKDAPLVQGAENKRIRKLYITGLEASYVAPPGKYWYQASPAARHHPRRALLLHNGMLLARRAADRCRGSWRQRRVQARQGGHGGEQASTGAPAIQAWDGGQAVWVPILPLLDLFHHSMPTALQQATTYFVESCFVGRKEASLQEAATTLGASIAAYQRDSDWIRGTQATFKVIEYMIYGGDDPAVALARLARSVLGKQFGLKVFNPH